MSLIDYQLQDGIATVTIRREEALNALNVEVLQGLRATTAQIAKDGVRCVIITGAGRAFVAGADIAGMSTMTSRQALEFSELGSRTFRDLEELPIPVIAAVNGFALGGGCELALACDIRIASTAAAFAQPEVGLGIPPGFGGTQRLARTVGRGMASQLLFTGDRIGAAEALAIGLVNSVHEPEELLVAATALAGRIASKAPIAVRSAKAALIGGLDLPLPVGLAIESGLFGSCVGTEDQREAMAAFVEKRKPAPFQDR